MKILITGSQGLLGQEVVEVCRNRGDEVLATDIASSAAPLDITSPAAVRGSLHRTDRLGCQLRAFTDVDGCEGREDLAFELNARAPGHLARACEEHGAKLLHISTDYVFDGEKSGPYEEDDEPNPLSVYGKSKRAGEISVQEGVEHYLIVRTQWLFGPHGRNFVSTILGLAQERDTLSVVNDQWGSPTYSKTWPAAEGAHRLRRPGRFPCEEPRKGHLVRSGKARHQSPGIAHPGRSCGYLGLSPSGPEAHERPPIHPAVHADHGEGHALMADRAEELYQGISPRAAQGEPGLTNLAGCFSTGRF